MGNTSNILNSELYNIVPAVLITHIFDSRLHLIANYSLILVISFVMIIHDYLLCLYYSLKLVYLC